MIGDHEELIPELEEYFEGDDPRIVHHRPIAELRSIMRIRVRNGEQPYEACLAYEDARSAYETLLMATNESAWDADKLYPWGHKHSILPVGKKKHLEPYILRHDAESAITEYLAGRVRTDQLDRTFLDAAIAAEMFAFMDEPIARRGSFSWRGYLLNIAICAFLLWVSDSAWWARVITVLLVTGPVWVPLIDKRGKVTRKISQSMTDAYRTLGGSVSSVREVRRALEAARDVGVVWPTPLWVLLEDIEARRTSV